MSLFNWIETGRINTRCSLCKRKTWIVREVTVFGPGVLSRMKCLTCGTVFYTASTHAQRDKERVKTFVTTDSPILPTL